MSDDKDDDKDNIITFPGPDIQIIDGVRTIEHPLEKLFDIESGTTVVEYKERVPVPLADHSAYDEKDKEIEGQFQELYDTALQSFVDVTDGVDGLEGKYQARNHEVATMYLQLALQAAKEKKELKQGKDRLEKTSKAAAGNTTNIVVTHSDILDMVRGMTIPSYDNYLEGEIIDPE